MRDEITPFRRQFYAKMLCDIECYGLRRGDIVDAAPDDHKGVGYDIAFGNPLKLGWVRKEEVERVGS